LEIKRIVLIGLSGTGKTTAARLIAARLGWEALDLDSLIERDTGRRIPELFANDGETAFRQIERRLLEESLRREKIVLATGGGAAATESAWSDMALRSPGTVVVALDGDPALLVRRLREQLSAAGETIERPLLAGADPEGRLREMAAARLPFYDRADLTVVTDPMSTTQVADTIARLVHRDGAPDVVLQLPTVDSRVTIYPGALSSLGSVLDERQQRARNVWVISDANVAALHGERVLGLIRESGRGAFLITVPPGESSKSWPTAGEVIGQMLDEGIQRNDVVIALGGGVVGDLAGFAAASVLRGVGLIQIPTSLLAMVDSSIGGKTGINHRRGKNLIGAFYQPPDVIIDPAFLRTLPARELTQSWAELVKHAIIQPSTPDPYRDDLIRTLTRNRLALSQCDGLAMTHIIRRNVALKARVVEKDEREASLRAILNYGHTIGHAIEAADYRYLHGEAIAVGMHAANHIATDLGQISSDRAAMLNDLVTSFGLPATAEFDPDAVRAKMLADKKRVAGRQAWVLPIERGGVELHADVPDSAVSYAIDSVRAPDSSI
jgi:shikimate kinase/3-dehydroquinate synthase